MELGKEFGDGRICTYCRQFIFKKVIALKDTNYYHSQFEFRFTNYATFIRNLDHWHIDYVRLDLDADTINKRYHLGLSGKVCFEQGYQQIPRKQYTGISADYFKNYVRNLFNQPINVSIRL